MKETSQDLIVNGIIGSLLKNKKIKDGSEILDTISIYCYADDTILYSLLDNGIISQYSSDTTIRQYKFIINKDKLTDPSLIKQILFYGDKKIDNSNYYLVASYPYYEDLNKVDDFESLYPMICRLIISADKQLLMVNPFYDKNGIEMIMPYLKSACDRGVKIKIISRIFYQTKQDKEYLEILKKGLNNSEIKQFGGYVDNKPFYLHAKFMVADDNMAYIGSANITEYSLGNNIEVGVICTGKKIIPLIDYFNLIWENSITYDILK